MNSDPVDPAALTATPAGFAMQAEVARTVVQSLELPDALLDLVAAMADAGEGHESQYDVTLSGLEASLPRLAIALRQAQRQRAQLLASLLHGARFRGLDELLRHLDGLSRAFESDPALQRIAFLVARSTADFETAVEATLSGYLAVAGDAMRDVLEIENLLLDFALAPAHVDEWLSADRKTLRSKFSQVSIRNRLHAAGEGRYATTAESADYRAHSESLHVNPRRSGPAAPGFSSEQGWGGDAGFWEIFMHARRLRRAIQRLTSALAPGATADQLAHQELASVHDAWKRTQEMQDLYLTLRFR